MKRPLVGGLAMVALVAVLLAVNFLRPVPAVAAVSLQREQSQAPGTAPALPWPAGGFAAVGVLGTGLIDAHDGSKPLPIASVAKVMTALVVLGDHPLAGAAAGPALAVSAADVSAYAADTAAGQSTVQVSAGEQLTERELLEGLLIPSGNNLADILAVWDAGSMPAFVARLNARAAAMKLTRTHFADASGFNPATVSVPSDLARLGMAALQDPVIAGIVQMPQVLLPVAGVQYNVDYALGQSGLVGIKTGSSPEAGANFLFAAQRQIQGGAATVVGAVMGLPTLDDAFSASEALVEAVVPALSVVAVVLRGHAYGRYSAPWDAATDLAADKRVDVVEWPGLVVRLRVEAPPADAPVAAGTQLGDLVLTAGDVKARIPLISTDPLPAPGRRWRLTRLTF